LVERQIAYADFAVDAGAVDLLRFKKNAFAESVVIIGRSREQALGTTA
jgi:hypothetical protein